MKAINYQCRQFIFFLALLMGATAPIQAQILVPPTSTEMVFGVNGKSPTCFNYDDIPFPIAFGKADIYLSAVDNHVYWLAFHPVTGAFVVGGTITYQNALDVNVGLRFSGVTPQLVVAYYNAIAPKGHRVEVYNWNAGGGSVTMAPGFPVALSALAAYTRISMDTHIDSPGFSSFNAIVWEDPALGIRMASCTGATPFIGGTIAGTVGRKRPDVAFSHLTGGGLTVHFVYHTGVGPGYTILESAALYSAMHIAGPLPAPALQDSNPVAGILGQLTCSMDCPDERAAGPDIWTYTYSNNNTSIFTRISATGGIGTTKDVLMAGSFVGLATGMAITFSDPRPRVSYNQSGNSLHEAFYSNLVQGPVNNNYYSMQINSAGTNLVSANDYERVAAAVAPGGTPVSIALSRQNKSNKYLYAVFCTSGGLVHKFHPWANTANFKSTGLENQNGALTAAELLAGPNPFAESVRLYMPENLKNEPMVATLTDVSGKLLLSYNGIAGEASAAVEQASKNLAAGTYFLTATLKNGDVRKHFKLQCTGTN